MPRLSFLRCPRERGPSAKVSDPFRSCLAVAACGAGFKKCPKAVNAHQARAFDLAALLECNGFDMPPVHEVIELGLGQAKEVTSLFDSHPFRPGWLLAIGRNCGGSGGRFCALFGYRGRFHDRDKANDLVKKQTVFSEKLKKSVKPGLKGIFPGKHRRWPYSGIYRANTSGIESRALRFASLSMWV
jgi:hypothetical protein